MDISLALAMINGLGHLALVAMLFGMLKRFAISPRLRSVALGLVFGAGAIVAMMTPAEVAPGVFIDTRAILVGLAGAFAGTPAALIAAAGAAAYRVWLGGAGMPMGILSIGLATIAGVGWLRFWPGDRRETPAGLAVLGAAIAVHSVVVLFVPVQLPGSVLLIYFPTIWATCLFATMTLGWTMQRELRLILRERSLAEFAFTDQLTGLANRRAFERRLAEPAFRIDGPPFGLVLLDIDHFKAINDRHGHDAGDAVLRHMAGTLARAVREGDFVARYGGEEFVILLLNADIEESRVIAERIRERIASNPFELLDDRVSVTASLGITASPLYADHQSMIAAADHALYRAKDLGRNRVEIAVPAAMPDRRSRRGSAGGATGQPAACVGDPAT